MPEIAPWENPNLPVPFAHVEREVEGRKRRFAMWQWDERLVWNDLDHPRLWWATLDVAASLADWERAIENWEFGRAFTSNCDKTINGRVLGLWPNCTFRLWRIFYAIVSQNGTGVAREKAGYFWLAFTPRDDAYTKSKIDRSPSVWHPNREFFGINREITRAFAPAFLERLAPGLRDFILLGDQATALAAMKDLVAWNVARQVLFADWMRQRHALYQKIIVGFELPAGSIFGAYGERKQINGVQLHFYISGEYQRWEIQTSVSLATTAHELLELQLRLRDALKPILTAAEIEEILAVPTRP